MVHIDAYENDMQKWLDACYGFYCADFIDATVTLESQPLELLAGDGCGDGRGEMFWHLTSEDTRTGRDRNHDRLRRIRWPRPMIDAARQAHLRFWLSKRPGGHERYHIALEDFSYIVIAEKRPKSALLITAYDVPFRNARGDLRREWLACKS